MQEQAREGSLALDSISHVQELVGPLHFLFLVFAVCSHALCCFPFRRKELGMVLIIRKETISFQMRRDKNDQCKLDKTRLCRKCILFRFRAESSFGRLNSRTKDLHADARMTAGVY